MGPPSQYMSILFEAVDRLPYNSFRTSSQRVLQSRRLSCPLTKRSCPGSQATNKRGPCTCPSGISPKRSDVSLQNAQHSSLATYL